MQDGSTQTSYPIALTVVSYVPPDDQPSSGEVKPWEKEVAQSHGNLAVALPLDCSGINGCRIMSMRAGPAFERSPGRQRLYAQNPFS